MTGNPWSCTAYEVAGVARTRSGQPRELHRQRRCTKTDDLDQVLTGGTGTVRLLDLTGTVGTARFSTSGLAMNIVIDNQLHAIPMRSLTPVITWEHRKGPLFIPSDALAPDHYEDIEQISGQGKHRRQVVAYIVPFLSGY